MNATLAPLPARTLSRLRKAARHDSHRTLSDVALADLVARGLFTEDTWSLTDLGRAHLAAADAADPTPDVEPPLTPRRGEGQRQFAMRVLFDDLMPTLSGERTIPWRVADRMAQRYGCRHYDTSPEGLEQVSTASVALTIARYATTTGRRR